MPYYEQEPQSVFESSDHKPYLDRIIANDRTVHNSRPDSVMLDKTIKDAHSYIFNLLKTTCYVMHQQFNVQQLYALSTLDLCVLYLSQNKQRLMPLPS
jgi:hypothetical protein